MTQWEFDNEQTVAIIGLAGRFPGAASVEEFWQNLRAGKESISFFDDAELAAAGVAPAERDRPGYVPAKAVLDDIAGFDAAYFGMSPREAALTDPQQRIFLEICQEALERAGVWPDSERDRIGVFGGVSKDTYLFFNLLSHPELRTSPGAQQTLIANDKDYLASRVSYKLGLRGPSMSVQTACSTSLVAVHLAAQSLLDQQCDYALAGGVAVDVPHRAGYVYESGGIVSPDGHCRAFDANARGTVFGQGAGVVVLRRLSDALAAGETVLAVLRGSAVNNDGADKMGFTAPSAMGQAAVIVEALTAADVDPRTVSYVEAHGTGTPLGDPIEVEALTRAYRLWTDQVGYCRIGSVKTNIGHLNTAAGAVGLIKAVLALWHGEIPPSLHFERPNPQIPFATTPFQVCTALTPWPDTGFPRRAGVSSFGIGGTNAHVVLEQAPTGGVPDDRTAGRQLIVVSARTAAGLRTATGRLAATLAERPELSLADVAYTQQIGRRPWPYRTAVVASDPAEAAELLTRAGTGRTGTPATGQPSVAFLFPGQGVQVRGLGGELYETESVFRKELDACSDRLLSMGAPDPRDVLLAADTDGGPDLVTGTGLMQPALFSLEYALAQLWISWGVVPDAVLGHSLGEIVAATVAGVLDRDGALALVAERSRRFAELPTGVMLAVARSADVLAPRLPAGVEIAAYNGPRQTVVTGPAEAVDELARSLLTERVPSSRLATSHAFHSAMVEPAVPHISACAAAQSLKPPSTPCLSNVTGDWVTAAQATDPAYWGRQLREPVRFVDCLSKLLADPGRILVEIGPGRTLGRLARQHPQWSSGHVLAGALPAPDPDGAAKGGEQAALLEGLGRLWASGVEPTWRALHQGRRSRMVVLPTYPFERRRHWIDPVTPKPESSVSTDAVVEAGDRGPAPDESLSAAQGAASPEPVSAGRLDAVAGGAARAVAGVFEDLLGVTDVAVTDDFFSLGGQSLLGVELAARLRDTLGVDLPLTAVLDTATPEAIARLAESAAALGVAAAVAGRHPDARADIWFDGEPESGAAARVADPGTVLLTGGTGFLGAFLLRDLLDHTSANVHVLVRAGDVASGRERILAGLRRYGLSAGVDPARVHVEIGELSAPRLGLSADAYRRLSREADAIYHNGAKVSFLETYRHIRPTNVDSTRAVLRLACEGRAKAVHYVSSIAALDCDAFRTVTEADEDVDLRAGGGFHGGYDESKWVAEQIVGLARARGVPAVVYRPGNIAGHSVTGAASQGHLVSAMIKGCVLLGVAPDVDSYLDVVPVDYVSRALVHLSLREDALGRTLHLVNPTAVRWSQIVAGLREFGYRLDVVPLPQWRETIRGGGDNPMRVFLPMLDERALFSGRRYRQDRTAALLAGSGIGCPPLDQTLLSTYVSRLVDTGELPRPGEVNRSERRG